MFTFISNIGGNYGFSKVNKQCNRFPVSPPSQSSAQASNIEANLIKFIQILITFVQISPKFVQIFLKFPLNLRNVAQSLPKFV